MPYDISIQLCAVCYRTIEEDDWSEKDQANDTNGDYVDWTDEVEQDEDDHSERGDCGSKYNV